MGEGKVHESTDARSARLGEVHLMCGVTTNIVTAVTISDRFVNDSSQFKPLVEATAKNFVMQEVSADKAYISRANLQVVVDHNAMPYIPFKKTSKPGTVGLGPNRALGRKTTERKQGALWRQMYHYYEFNHDWFMQQYHKRRNVESTFSMIKAKFGDSLRSRAKTAQVNETLCKILAHNICCVIQSMFELNIKPEFGTSREPKIKPSKKWTVPAGDGINQFPRAASRATQILQKS